MSTRQAALRLGLSEATVRRLADRGALPVKRVGTRKERRFRPEQVDRFAGRQARRVANETRSPLVVLGGAPVAAPRHLAAFYDTDAARTRMTAPFLGEGLIAGEPCFLLAQDDELDDYVESLRNMPGVDVEAALASGQLTVADAPGTTAQDGLEYWERNLWLAFDQHAPLIRAVGEMVSERKSFVSEQEMLGYEAALNLTIRRFPCVVICQYDVRKFSGQAVLAAMHAHPDMLGVPIGALLK